jgi:hypothetical protein
MNDKHNELMAYVLDYPEEAAREIEQLRKVQAAALRVASSRRKGIVKDKSVLDLLDEALEVQEPARRIDGSIDPYVS